MKTNEMTQSEQNARAVLRRAILGVPIILVVALLVTGGDEAPIQWLFAYFNSPAVLWTVGIILFMMVVAVGVWTLAPLCKRRAGTTCRNASKLIIVCGLSYLMATLQLSATQAPINSTGVAQASSVVSKGELVNPNSLTAEQNAQVQTAVQGYISSLTPEDLVRAEQENGIQMTLLTGLLLVTVVIVVIAGVLYVGWQIYKAIKKLVTKINKRNKIGEDDEKTNTTSQVMSSTETAKQWAALLPGGDVYATSQEEAYSPLPQFGFSLVVPGSADTSIPITVYTQGTVDFSEYLSSHGLGTNVGVASYSEDNVPIAGEQSPIQQTGTRTATISYENRPNMTIVIKCTPSLEAPIIWELVGELTLPTGSHLRFCDVTHNGAPSMFYSVTARNP